MRISLPLPSLQGEGHMGSYASDIFMYYLTWGFLWDGLSTLETAITESQSSGICLSAP